MKKFIIKNTEGEVLYKTEARSFREAVEEALSSLGTLAGADLRGANLIRANLYRADLTGANLEGANLIRANLYRADLEGADLEGANLYRADLTGANLIRANIEDAYLGEADLQETATPSLSELESKIVLWAKEKGITSKDNAKNQFLKTVEETGELASALAKNDLPEIKDAVGDIIVTLIILAEIKGFSATEALSNVYDIISKRTGKTIGGVFVKDE